MCILNGKHWNHEPSKIHTFIFFHLPRHWHCIGTATCEIGPRRTKGLGIWVSKGGTAAVFPCSPSQSSCLGGSEPPPSPEKIDVGEKIKVQTSRGWETLRTACSSIFLRPELQCFWPLLNRCAKKWNVGLGKSKYINHGIFYTDQNFVRKKSKSLFALRLGCARERSTACRHFGGMELGIVLGGGF